MIIVCIGDIVGRSGRAALKDFLPTIRQRLKPDIVVVNAENAAGGFGITQKIADEIFALDVDVLTLGNHAWDNLGGLSVLTESPKVVRPINVSPLRPGRGSLELTVRGYRIQVVNVSGRVSMAPLYDCPFMAVDGVIPRGKTPSQRGLHAVMVDIHAEATSEKAALAYYLDGRVSVVWGTHTHVPTSDTRILENGTAFQSDLGMTGDYNSIIGMDVATILPRMRGETPQPRMETANGPGTVCGMVVSIDPNTGLAKTVRSFCIGGVLPPTLVT